MNLFETKCKRFSRFTSEARDRDLTEAENSFMSDHRAICPECSRSEILTSLAMQLLQSSTFEYEPQHDFDTRLARKMHSDQIKNGIRYWKPAFVGLAVGALLVLATLQMLGQPKTLPAFRSPGAEARRTRNIEPVFPDLNESIIHNID